MNVIEEEITSGEIRLLAMDDLDEKTFAFFSC